MNLEKVLIVEGESVICKALEEQLRAYQCTVVCTTTLASAKEWIAKENFDLAFVDTHLSDGDGTTLLDYLKELYPCKPKPWVVMMTGYGSIQSAVDCIQRGAADYILKPFSLQEIEGVLKKIEANDHARSVNQFLSSGSDSENQLIGKSVGIQQVHQLIRKVATTEATVLITGENGTGKELVARAIYRQSHLANNPYIAVNCAAIPDTLIESEFFGHEKGAFTHAMQRRIGRFELANNGTLLLDEIGEIPQRLQAKLLRVLQEKEFERVGGNTTMKVNVRIIASTNRNLQKMVKDGIFREDLFYRLNVFPIAIPPLRERQDDILLLAAFFLERYQRKYGVHLKGFSEGAREALVMHTWPGNVRELQNAIERSVIMTPDRQWIDPSALNIITAPASIVVSTSTNPQSLSLHEVEKQHILRILNLTNGNRTKAADLLKITARTLSNKLREYHYQSQRVKVKQASGDQSEKLADQ